LICVKVRKQIGGSLVPPIPGLPASIGVPYAAAAAIADTIGDAQDVGGNPVHRPAVARESSVHDHELALGHDYARFVLERRRGAFDQIEKSLTARLDMCTVLNVAWRAVSLGGRIIALVEQRFERFKDKRFVSRFPRLVHLVAPESSRLPARAQQASTAPYVGARWSGVFGYVLQKLNQAVGGAQLIVVNLAIAQIIYGAN
jgi:hypothetical protein